MSTSHQAKRFVLTCLTALLPLLALAACTNDIESVEAPESEGETLSSERQQLGENPSDSNSTVAIEKHENTAANTNTAPPLNLDVPPEVALEGELVATPDEPARLPNLFTPQEKKNSPLSGSLMVDENQPMGRDAVTGAEIKLDVPIN